MDYNVFLSVVIVLIVVLVIINIVRTEKINRTFLGGKLKLVSQIQKNAKSGKFVATVSIINQTFNNINIVSCGIYYRVEKYDFLKEYRTEMGINNVDRVYVPQRDSIDIIVDLDSFIKCIDKKFVTRVFVYVQDNLGRVSKKGSRALTKSVRLTVDEINKKINAEKAAARLLEKQKEKETKAKELEIRTLQGKLTFRDKLKKIFKK